MSSPRNTGLRRPTNLLNGIDLLTLRILLAAREEGNLARVAERENIAISAVSRRIADFEQRYGFAVFNRHDRGVSATPDGTQFLDRLMGIIGQLEQVAGELIDRRDGVAGVIRIQAHISSMMAGLPAKLADFLRANPSIDIILEEGKSIEIIHDIQAGLCDVGLISGTMDVRSLESLPLAGDELVAILPPGSPLAARAELSLAEMLDEPFVGMQHDSALLTLYRSHAIALNRMMLERVHATSFESVRACVAAGLGVSILPATAVLPFAEQQNLVVRPLTDSWAKRPLQLCFRSKGQISAAARLLIKHLTE